MGGWFLRLVCFPYLTDLKMSDEISRQMLGSIRWRSEKTKARTMQKAQEQSNSAGFRAGWTVAQREIRWLMCPRTCDLMSCRSRCLGTCASAALGFPVETCSGACGSMPCPHSMLSCFWSSMTPQRNPEPGCRHRVHVAAPGVYTWRQVPPMPSRPWLLISRTKADRDESFTNA